MFQGLKLKGLLVSAICISTLNFYVHLWFFSITFRSVDFTIWLIDGWGILTIPPCSEKSTHKGNVDVATPFRLDRNKNGGGIIYS